LTTQAQALEQQLTARQARRIAAAFEDAGAEAASGFTEVLRAIINKEDRQRLEKPLNTAKGTGTPASSPGRRAITRDD
jgi:hypothetical protein